MDTLIKAGLNLQKSKQTFDKIILIPFYRTVNMVTYNHKENMFEKIFGFERITRGENIMWTTDERIRERKVALADGGYAEPQRERRSDRKLSRTMAMVIGVLVTLEIMIAGAMVLNFDFRGADVIALGLGFMVLYSGVVALLTDK